MKRVLLARILLLGVPPLSFGQSTVPANQTLLIGQKV